MATMLKAEIGAGRTVKLGARGRGFRYRCRPCHLYRKTPREVFSAPMPDATVYVDVRLDEDLETEGYAREVIRRINEMRKQLDLVVSDFISVEVLVNE